MGRELFGGRRSDSPQLESSLLDQKEDGGGPMATDWPGKIAVDRQLGGWRSSFLLLGVFCFCNFATAGIFSNWVVYLVSVWNESSAAAATSVTNLFGTIYISSLIGAFMSDAYIGRLWASLIFQATMLLGCISVSIIATLQAISNGSSVSATLRVFLFISMYIMGLGVGSYQPSLIALGADQFDGSSEKGKYFNRFIVLSNSGQVLGMIVLSYLEDNGMWALAFWISSVSVGIAIIFFVIAAPKSRQYKAGGNPFIRILQVIVAAIRKLSLKAPQDAISLHELSTGESAIRGSRKIVHTENLRWLDKAAIVKDEDVINGLGTSSAWKLCTVTQVEEVKCVARTLPIFLTGIIYAAVNAQANTLFVEQGETMDRRVAGSSINFPASSMQLFTVFGAILFVLFDDTVLVPMLRRRTGQPKGVTALQRLGLAYLIAIVAMVVSGLVERRRLEIAKRHDSSDGAVPFSIFWLVPQYVMLGVAQAYSVAGGQDFFYSEVSDAMKSLGSSLPYLLIAVGNYGSSILVGVTTAITGHGAGGWIAKDLNEGHLDYFYWMLGGLVALQLCAFLGYTHRYTHMQVVEGGEGEGEGEDDGFVYSEELAS